MSRIKFIEYGGKKILLEDFSNIKPGEEFDRAIKQAAQLIRSQPPKSVLALFDASGAVFDTSVLAALKDFVKLNTPFIKSAAAVGIEGMLKIALNVVTRVAGRPFKTFKDRKSAVEWLIRQ